MTGTAAEIDPFWVYQARLSRLVDGDTYDLLVDLGFRTSREIRVRLLGADTAEIYGVKRESDEFARGQEHSRFVREWFAVAADDDGGARRDESWPLRIVTHQDRTGKYGRYVASVVRRVDGADLATDLIEAYPDVEVADADE